MATKITKSELLAKAVEYGIEGFNDRSKNDDIAAAIEQHEANIAQNSGERMLSLQEAADQLDISSMALRQAIKKGKLKAILSKLGDTERKVWRIKQQDLTEYLQNKGNRSSDAGKAWVIRLTPALMQKYAAQFAQDGIELEPRYSYDADYQKARRQSKARELVEATDEEVVDETTDKIQQQQLQMLSEDEQFEEGAE